MSSHRLPAIATELFTSRAPAGANTIQGNCRSLDDAIAAGKLRRRSTGPRGIWISSRVHLWPS